MTPLLPPFGGSGFAAWRLDAAVHGATWSSGVGASNNGGRWNLPGTHAVYCSLDPATAILEVAVHVGFDDLDRVARVLTCLQTPTADTVFVVDPELVPNPNWLRPGRPSANQQAFGNHLLATHAHFVVPSAVSTRSWNYVFLAGRRGGAADTITQERFALDTRLTT